jgi:ribosomal 50S subunit-recycling heat shock protein
MRLDKYLKVSRIIKRRTIAKEVADKGRIKLNGVLAKSSTDVKIDDVLRIQFGNKILEVKVLEMKDSTKKEDAEKMYEIISETRTSSQDQAQEKEG